MGSYGPEVEFLLTTFVALKRILLYVSLYSSTMATHQPLLFVSNHYCEIFLGLPDRVENISITPALAFLSLSWDWPALSTTNTTFCVSVYHVRTERNGCGGASITEQCMIESTRYEYSDGIDRERYGFVVTAVSSMGRGPPSACVKDTFRFTSK